MVWKPSHTASLQRIEQKAEVDSREPTSLRTHGCLSVDYKAVIPGEMTDRTSTAVEESGIYGRTYAATSRSVPYQ